MILFSVADAILEHNNTSFGRFNPLSKVLFPFFGLLLLSYFMIYESINGNIVSFLGHFLDTKGFDLSG